MSQIPVDPRVRAARLRAMEAFRAWNAALFPQRWENNMDEPVEGPHRPVAVLLEELRVAFRLAKLAGANIAYWQEIGFFKKTCLTTS